MKNIGLAKDLQHLFQKRASFLYIKSPQKSIRKTSRKMGKKMKKQFTEKEI